MEESKTNQIEVQSVIDTQIKQFYSTIARERDNQVKVRNWSITLWLAYIAIVGSGKFSFSIISSILILIIINIIFWTIEGLHHSIVLINEKKVRKLEELLTLNELPKSIPLTLFYSSGHNTINKKEKINTFLISCFLCETVIFFYLAMIIGSILFVLFISNLK